MSVIDFGKIPVYPTLLTFGGEEAQAGNNTYHHGGITHRELFAAMAMQGLALNTNAYYETGPHNEAIAKRAVALADALLAELHDCKP